MSALACTDPHVAQTTSISDKAQALAGQSGGIAYGRTDEFCGGVAQKSGLPLTA